MKLFKISTIALAMALTGWVACGSSGNSTDVPVIPTSGTGGTIAPDGPMGTGGSGGSLDAGNPPDTAMPDVSITPDAPPTVDAGLPFDGGGNNLCIGLSPADCHLAIINAVTDPSVSALDPGPNPPVPYPNCAAQ